MILDYLGRPFREHEYHSKELLSSTTARLLWERFTRPPKLIDRFLPVLVDQFGNWMRRVIHGTHGTYKWRRYDG